MFYDLNLHYHSANHDSMRKSLDLLQHFGYHVVAFNHVVTGKLTNAHVNQFQKLEGTWNLQQLSRLTIIVEDLSHNYGLVGLFSLMYSERTRCVVPVLYQLNSSFPCFVYFQNSNNPTVNSYDLFAVQPTSEKLFQAACSTYEVDIISLDFSTRLPFYLKHAQVGQAIERGVYFEICYSAGIRGESEEHGRLFGDKKCLDDGLVHIVSNGKSLAQFFISCGFVRVRGCMYLSKKILTYHTSQFTDQSARRHLISNAQSLVRVSRGKNIIISSEAQRAMELRGPYDLVNLGTLFGLNQADAKDCISTNCRTVVYHSITRRKTHKAVIRHDSVRSLQPDEAWKIGGTAKRGIEDVEEPEDEAETESGRGKGKAKMGGAEENEMALCEEE
ncbi:RNase P subunit p30-domain-containing protein [Endogone sp. FLAS-F59071]|nr:RNase P subunit p30-domain-containing protein [Endogone sp. FLAS-F59071]|eukprot:RUS13723.1 RNase P subunit p30-domain-containing protein [Endogone sp. FLAS-F59071]